MSEIKIESQIMSNTIEIEASYPEYAMLEAGFDEPFRNRLVEEYEKLAGEKGLQNCILSINAQVAASQVVKGIFELYRSVRARSGTLVCARYPADYVRALADLGLPSLPGFELCNSIDEAREKLSVDEGESHLSGSV